MHLSVFLFCEFAQSQWRAQHSLKNMTEPAVLLMLPRKCVIPDELEVRDSQWLRKAGNGEQQGSSLGSLELQKWPASFVPGEMMVTDSVVFSQGPLNPIARTLT